jgi:hypothetical protein
MVSVLLYVAVAFNPAFTGIEVSIIGEWRAGAFKLPSTTRTSHTTKYEVDAITH